MCGQTDFTQLRQVPFFQTEVTFAGFQLSSNGYQVDRSITDASCSNQPNRATILLWISQPVVRLH